ncbi:MAG: hypothetical protein H0W46_09210 [Acidimicrobiia bacterium]|nr:hypothetical protein [Acidimicrobiia bacterium]
MTARHCGSIPNGPKPASGCARAFLLPTFDEAFLTYKTTNFPRHSGHPRGTAAHSFAEAGGGLVIVDRHDAGWWRHRQLSSGGDLVTVAVAGDVDASDWAAVAAAADRLAQFTGRPVRLELR